MRCAKCGTDNPSTNKFCAQCGSALDRICANCRTENPATSSFCGECGTSLVTAARPRNPAATTSASSLTTPQTAASRPGAASTPGVQPDSARGAGAVATVSIAPDLHDNASALEGERKTVTALFADIKGSTELEQDLDPEEARAIIDPALKLMIDAVHRYDGYIVQSTGDGIFALFGAPVAHEDHPQRALYAGLRMQDELKRYSARLREAGNLPLEARVGVNTGEVVVRTISTGAGHAEYTPIGHTNNLAARMQALAPTGSIAVTDATRLLCEGYFVFKPLGPSRVKGIAAPVEVFETVGLGPLRTRLQRSAGRGLTKFVGRTHEMNALAHAAEQARRGHGQIVAAMAEAGTGKSRLLFEFKAKNQSGWTVLEAFSVSHGKATAYMPAIDLLHSYFRIAPEDDSRTRREKVTGKILTLDRSLEDTLPYLFGLLGLTDADDALAGMDPPIRRRRTLDAIKRIMLRESLNQPLMVMFEDLHWIDEETQALLNLLADSIGTAKILLLVNYRPEYSHTWTNKSYYTQLRLDPLGKETADEMLTAMLGDDASIAALKRMIIEKTEGNPFFMEEIVQALFEDGAIKRDGAVSLARPLEAMRIPTTVQGLLASRIDRLAAPSKTLLQTLAVIGKEFSLSLVRAVVADNHDNGAVASADAREHLERMLADLQLAEFIYEQPASGDVEYTFKHALTQEVAYNSVLAERRRPIHNRVAGAFEALYAKSLDDHLGEIAHHYSRSSESRKAVEFLGLAAAQAMSRSAFKEARAYLSDGLKLIERVPDDDQRAAAEMILQSSMGRLLMVTAHAGSRDVERCHLRVLELSERVGNSAQHVGALFGLRLLSMLTGDLERAKSYGNQLLAFAEREANPSYMGAAYFAIASTMLAAGDLQTALQHGEVALGGSEIAGAPELMFNANPKSVIGFILAQTLCYLGFPDRARRIASQSLSASQASSTTFANILGTAFDGEFQLVLRDAKQCLADSDAVIAMCLETGAESQIGRAMAMRAWALTQTGSLEEGIEQLERSIQTMEAIGVGVIATAHCALAQALHAAKRADDGLAVVNRGLALISRTGENVSAPELHRVKGELTLLRDPNAIGDAEASMRQAIAIARAQSARWTELRATVSLARLLRASNRGTEARATLSEIYGWFTEGFDTLTLTEAKSLLDELGA